MTEIVIDKILNEEELKEINNSPVKNIKFLNLNTIAICDMIEYLNEDKNIVNDNKNIKRELSKRYTYQGFKKSILNEVKRQIKMNLTNTDKAIDATVGNGHDTLYLAQVLNKGYVFGFDIQSKAINNTKELIKDYNNVFLYKLSHEYMDRVVKEKVKLIIFNLGYLPSGNKNITTKVSSTLKALKVSLNLILDDGLILVVVYPGHPEGKKEKENILKWLNEEKINYIIKRNTANEVAPFLIIIKK